MRTCLCWLLSTVLLAAACGGGVTGTLLDGGTGNDDGGGDDDGGGGPDAPLPVVPSDLEAFAVSATEIDLCWGPAAGQPTYHVYRNGTRIASVTETAHRDGTASPETLYEYHVTAETAGVESAPSLPDSDTTFAADADGDVSAAGLTSYSTIRSLGFEWDVLGDADHDATVSVGYRAAGTCRWRPGMPLVRVDFNGRNMLAGSVFFVAPGTPHEVTLHLRDPDGGARTLHTTLATRAVPVLPAGGRTLHVVPGAGGGDGSTESPFNGIAAAQAAAQPGDVFLLHAGHYGGRITFDVPGEAGAHVAWVAAGDGDPVFAGIEVTAPHLRFEGLRIEAGGGYDFPIGLKTQNAPDDVAVIGCTVVDNHYGIWLNHGGNDWTIAHNVIVGNNTVESGSFSGEGVELEHTSGHVVAYNRISLVGDGVSYCDHNCDIYGNDIFDTSDDGVEPDYGYANVRIWGNRMHNTGHNGVSFQPMQGAPWYIFRNQLVGHSETPMKLRGADRFFFAHNTIVEWGDVENINGDQMLAGVMRNNLWVSRNGGRIWDFEAGVPDWRTDLDHDGFDWAGSTSPFQFQGVNYPDLASFSAATGLEPHGVEVDRAVCFPALDFPAPPPASVPAQVLELAPGCAAIDSGELLPNLGGAFAGSAPDLGAHESGLPAATYGPGGPL